jgi:hypothetical protein
MMSSTTLVFYSHDDLAASDGIRLQPHQPVKHGEPVVVGDLPEEQDMIGFYGTAMLDPDMGRFRMWYTGYKPQYMARYAESEDGITWTKPLVGDSAWTGLPNSNAVMPGQFPVVITAPDAEDPLDRFRLFQWNGAMNLYRSVDGLKWERHPARWNPVWPLEAGEGLGEVPIPFWDTLRKEYIALTRIWTGPRPRARDRFWDGKRGEYVKLGGMSVRMVGRGSSPDGIFWAGPDIIHSCDNLDPLGSQPYETAAFPYAGRHIVLLGIYHSRRNPDVTLADTLRLYLGWSTDGCYTIERLADRLFELVPLGETGTWDAGMITQPTGFVEVGDEWWIYYGGHSGRHGESGWRSGVGLAKMPRGRLVSMTTDGTGTATSRPCTPTPGSFWVNADGRAGTVRVEVRGAGVIPAGVSDPINTDGVRLPVTWGGHAWKTSTNCPPVQVTFHLEKAAHVWECGWE